MDVTKIIKRPFQIRIPGGWEKHYFETSEDMIVNVIQSLGDSGYLRIPGTKLIFQWGYGSVKVSRSTNGTYWGETSVNYPITFPTSCVYAHAITRAAKTFSTASYGISGSMRAGFKPQFYSFDGTDTAFIWFTLGY